MTDSPLTCGRCHNSPAARLVVVNAPRMPQVRRLGCVPCASKDMQEAESAGWAAWEFSLNLMVTQDAATTRQLERRTERCSGS